MSNNKETIYKQERAHELLQPAQWSYNATRKHEDIVARLKVDYLYYIHG